MNPILLFLLLSCVAWGSEIKISVLTSVKNGTNEIGIGSRLKFEDVTLNQKIQTTFIGFMKNHETFGDEILLLDESSGDILMVDAESIKGHVIKKKMQSVVSPFDQSGETCAAYALFHFWRQLSVNAPSLSSSLTSTMSYESGRLKFLEESITNYYMGRISYLRTVMKKYAQRFGLKCKESNFKDPKKAIEFIVSKTLNAQPVLIEFNLGPDMDESKHVVRDYEINIQKDSRLWYPRKRGQKNTGGHAIVAVGSFEYLGQPKALVLDSNWTEARVWDLNKYLDFKTAMDEVSFHSCE
jgi:hypothetical protein